MPNFYYIEFGKLSIVEHKIFYQLHHLLYPLLSFGEFYEYLFLLILIDNFFHLVETQTFLSKLYLGHYQPVSLSKDDLGGHKAEHHIYAERTSLLEFFYYWLFPMKDDVPCVVSNIQSLFRIEILGSFEEQNVPQSITNKYLFFGLSTKIYQAVYSLCFLYFDSISSFFDTSIITLQGGYSNS